jgi:hypothetical protein
MYYHAFRDFEDSNSIEAMSDIVAQALTVSYHKRLAYLEGKKIIGLVEYAKLHKTSLSNVINKAHRQTIEAFMLRGRWVIGV